MLLIVFSHLEERSKCEVHTLSRPDSRVSKTSCTISTDTNLAFITVLYQKLYDLQNAAGKQQQRQEQISGGGQEGKGTVSMDSILLTCISLKNIKYFWLPVKAKVDSFNP